MKYLVVVEESDNGFGAYVPDLPGCVAVAESRVGVVHLIQEAIEIHIEDLQKSGNTVPQPISQGELVDVHAS
jgi:predicted RNase H-like HicB family nuclease